ncbi:MAG: hypothetical protein LBP53_06885 [Candidatus Peribacteria bacterium]|jgi:hypothetical protein|nr:hypothetical protein [Candidatus Peribacteria bacterium]
MLVRLAQQITLNPELATTITTLIGLLSSDTTSQVKKQQLLKKLAEV